MSGELDDTDKAWTRKAAIEEIDYLKLIRATAWEQHSHSFKWLTASLLALNGGATLSVFDREAVSPDHQIYAAAAFVVGILFALLVGVFGQHSTESSLAPLQRQIGYWMSVAEDGERVESIEQEIRREMRNTVRLGLCTRIFGWLSALAFVIGVITAGFGLHSDVRSNDEADREADRLD